MLALFSLDQTLPEQDLTNLEINLPAELHERITNVFEMTRLTGLEPTSLPDAALLALHLREFRRKEGSWDAISENLLTGKCRLAVWKTAFAILPQLVPDFDAAMDSLVAELSPQHAETLGSLIVHQVVINPADENIRYQTYRRRLQKAPIELQISALRAMRSVEDESLIKLLANSFLAQAQSANGDFNKNAGQSTVESFRQQAILSQIAGQPAQASRAIDHAFDALNRQQAEILRNLAFELESSNPEEARKTWEEILRLQPDNTTYKKEYAEFLIANDDPDYGYEILQEIPDDATRALYALRYPVISATDPEGSHSLDKALEKTTLQTSSSRFSSESDNLKAARYAFETKSIRLPVISSAKPFRKILTISRPSSFLVRLIATWQTSTMQLNPARCWLCLNSKSSQQKGSCLSLPPIAAAENALRIYQDLIHASNEPSRTDLLNFAEISIKASQAEKAIPIAQAS